MRRFELFAERLLQGVADEDVAPLMETLSEEELVRLLGGMPASAPADRLRKNIVTTELENRIVRMRTLLGEAARPAQERDLGAFTSALARALRVEGACVDEIVGGVQFRLHGHYGLPAPIMETEQCATSSMAMCEHVLHTRRTLSVPNIADDPAWRSAPAFTRHGLRHYSGAPGFTADGSLRCVVWVADRRPRALREEEIELIERLAARLAGEFATPDVRAALLQRALAA